MPTSIPLAHLSQFSTLKVDKHATQIPLRDRSRYTPEHRAQLADALIADLHRWDAPVSACAAAELLRQPNTYAVVTGQQAGVLTGSLYSIYKAIGAVIHARLLRGEYPEFQFVPVFWIEGDDHDIAEASAIGLLDRAGKPITLHYDDGDPRPLHVGDRLVSQAGLATFAESLREHLLPTDFSDRAVGLLIESYRPSETLADGFARAFYAMLGDTNIVLLNSRSAPLKRLAADLFATAIQKRDEAFQMLSVSTGSLKAAGLPTPIEPKPGMLFLTHNGERRGLEQEGERYRIKGTEEWITESELQQTAANRPDLLSPNVTLRPIIQDGILPTVAYIGGPTELAYQRQMAPLYKLFGMDAPALIPRPFVTLLEPKVRRVIESGKWSLEQLLHPEFDPAIALLDNELNAQLQSAAERALALVNSAEHEFAELTGQIDASLKGALGAAATAARKQFDDFSKRLRSGLKKREQTEIDRLTAAQTLLLPNGTLQERFLNPIYFINKFGLEGMQNIIAQIEAGEGIMQVINV